MGMSKRERAGLICFVLYAALLIAMVTVGDEILIWATTANTTEETAATMTMPATAERDWIIAPHYIREGLGACMEHHLTNAAPIHDGKGYTQIRKDAALRFAVSRCRDWSVAHTGPWTEPTEEELTECATAAEAYLLSRFPAVSETWRAVTFYQASVCVSAGGLAQGGE